MFAERGEEGLVKFLAGNIRPGREIEAKDLVGWDAARLLVGFGEFGGIRIGDIKEDEDVFCREELPVGGKAQADGEQELEDGRFPQGDGRSLAWHGGKDGCLGK